MEFFFKRKRFRLGQFHNKCLFLAITTVITTGLRLITTGKIQHLTMSKQLLIAFSQLGLEKVYQGRETFDAIIEKQAFSQFFFDLQARATSEIAVASLRDLDNLYTLNCTRN